MKIDLRERMVRLKEELKNQRNLMKPGFQQVDMRLQLFESRFSRITVIITADFVIMTVLMSVYRFVGQ